MYEKAIAGTMSGKVNEEIAGNLSALHTLTWGGERMKHIDKKLLRSQVEFLSRIQEGLSRDDADRLEGVICLLEALDDHEGGE